MRSYLIGAAWLFSLALAIILSYGAGEQRREAGAAMPPKAFEIVEPLTARELHALESPDATLSFGWIAARADKPNAPQPRYAVLPLPDDYRPAQPVNTPTGNRLIVLPVTEGGQSTTSINGCGCWTEASGARRCGCWN